MILNYVEKKFYEKFKDYKRNKARVKIKGLYEYADYKTVIFKFWNALLEEYENNPAGVYIKGLGYFCAYEQPNEVKNDRFKNSQRVGRPIIFDLIATEEKKPILRFFSFRGSIYPKFSYKYKRLRRSGVKPLYMYDVILNTQIKSTKVIESSRTRIEDIEVLKFLLRELQ
jgi:hypothetical protein